MCRRHARRRVILHPRSTVPRSLERVRWREPIPSPLRSSYRPVPNAVWIARRPASTSRHARAAAPPSPDVEREAPSSRAPRQPARCPVRVQQTHELRTPFLLAPDAREQIAEVRLHLGVIDWLSPLRRGRSPPADRAESAVSADRHEDSSSAPARGSAGRLPNAVVNACSTDSPLCTRRGTCRVALGAPDCQSRIVCERPGLRVKHLTTACLVKLVPRLLHTHQSSIGINGVRLSSCRYSGGAAPRTAVRCSLSMDSVWYN